MIKECVMWVGRMMSTYQNEIDEWLDQSDSITKFSFRADEIDADFSSDNEEFSEGGGLFGEMNVVIYNAQSWSAAQAQKALSIYDNMMGEVRVAMVFAGGEPSKNTAKYATEAIRERYVPYDPDEMTTWMVDWLATKDVTLRPRDAMVISHHIGDNVDMLIKGLNSIAVSDHGKTVVLSEVIHMFGGVTGADVFQLMGDIRTGKTAKSLETYQRVVNQGDQDLAGMMFLMSSTFRAYVALAFDKNTDLATFGIHGGRAYYVQKEASALNKSKGLAVLEAVRTADQKSFGGSSLSMADIMMELVISLTRVFSNR